MATETVREEDSFTQLWPQINQLEEILEVMNEAMVGDMDARARMNRLGNLLGAAQAIAASLAHDTGVR